MRIQAPKYPGGKHWPHRIFIMLSLQVVDPALRSVCHHALGWRHDGCMECEMIDGLTA